jgi:hypothetical protein
MSVSTSPKEVSKAINTARTTLTLRHFIITREYDSPTTFYEKYRPKWWQLKESMEDGRIAVHNINGRNRINVAEAIQILWPNATYEIVVPTKESAVDLFA